eukprot:gene7726-9502_t
MSNSYELYRKIFNNKYLANEIFGWIRKLNQGRIVKKYNDIKTSLWMTENGYFHLLKYKIKKNGPESLSYCLNSMGQLTKKIKDFKLFKSIHKRISKQFEIYCDNYIDHAAESGCLEIVKYLHEKGMSATFMAVDSACWGGYFDIVKFLLENRTEGGSKDGYEFAAGTGRLDLMKYLEEKLPNLIKPISRSVSLAMENGHFKVLQYLYENHNGPSVQPSKRSFDHCCANGHMEIVKWMLDNKYIQGPTDLVYNELFGSGQIEVYKFLKSRKVIQAPKTNSKVYQMFAEALKNGQNNMVQYLLYSKIIKDNGNGESVEYILDKEKTSFLDIRFLDHLTKWVSLSTHSPMMKRQYRMELPTLKSFIAMYDIVKSRFPPPPKAVDSTLTSSEEDDEMESELREMLFYQYSRSYDNPTFEEVREGFFNQLLHYSCYIGRLDFIKHLFTIKDFYLVRGYLFDIYSKTLVLYFHRGIAMYLHKHLYLSFDTSSLRTRITNKDALEFLDEIQSHLDGNSKLVPKSGFYKPQQETCTFCNNSNQ